MGQGTGRGAEMGDAFLMAYDGPHRYGSLGKGKGTMCDSCERKFAPIMFQCFECCKDDPQGYTLCCAYCSPICCMRGGGMITGPNSFVCSDRLEEMGVDPPDYDSDEQYSDVGEENMENS